MNPTVAPNEHGIFWNSLAVLEGQHWINREFKGRGEFEFSGSLRISGEWKGSIQSPTPGSQLHVMKTGLISGTLRVERLSVEGNLSDIEIEADWLRVMAGGKISGKIRVKRLIIDEGAVVEGRIVAHR